MKMPFKTIPVIFSFSLVLFLPGSLPEQAPPIKVKTQKTAPKIQVAILLDVSNSMDGLIEQAKAQLWNMVNVLGKATCEGQNPQIEIALYEYGRSNNDSKVGYVKQVSPFTGDLDKLSQQLFKLTTNGGDEYCGQVIYTSLNELNWDPSPSSYKVIFISGNEDFLQGNLLYTTACAEAKKKGVVVNTIYCGDRMQGIKEHWNLLNECGNGSFTNINSDIKPQDIPTPYDSVLVVLNDNLNKTYIYYGNGGKENYALQGAMDAANMKVDKSVAVNRAVTKANNNVYNNAGWDLLDANRADSSFISKVDLKTLPDSLQHKSRAEIKKIVDKKEAERGAIQKNIVDVSKQREAYIAAEKKKDATNNGKPTLETEVERTIREQAKRFNMKIN